MANGNKTAKRGPVQDTVAILQYGTQVGSNLVTVVGPQKKIKPHAIQNAGKRKMNLPLPANF